MDWASPQRLVWCAAAADGNAPFILGTVVSVHKDHLIIVDANNVQMTIPKADVLPYNQTESQDISQLTYVNEATVLACLSSRYIRGEVFTECSSASALIAIRPGIGTAIARGPAAISSSSPHPYHTMAMAYRALAATSKPQCVVAIGVAGSGKTQNLRLATEYLFQHPPAKALDPDFSAKVANANIILEAFTHATCDNNISSSRVCRADVFLFDKNLRLAGCKTSLYALDVTRLHDLPAGHRCFNVFYYLIKGSIKQQKQDLGLINAVEFDITNRGNKTKVELVDDAAEFKRLTAALDKVGVDEEEMKMINSVLAAILHLGNIRFEQESSSMTARVDRLSSMSLKLAARLLGVTEVTLGALLISFGRRHGNPMSPRTSGLVANRSAQVLASHTRDLCVEYLYEIVVAFVLDRVNKSLAASSLNDTPNRCIVVFDECGFQRNRSPDQPCNAGQFNSNFQFERLLHEFQQSIFTAHQQLLQKEGLEIPTPEYTDNEDIIDVIENADHGILMLLQETEGSTDSSFLDKLFETSNGVKGSHSSNLLTRSETSSQFVLAHSMGDVVYSATSLVLNVVSQDPTSLVGLMRLSKRPKMELLLDFDSQRSFQRSMDILDDVNKIFFDIKDAAHHYILCLSPSEQSDGSLDQNFLHQQVLQLNILNMAKFYREGFPYSCNLYDIYRTNHGEMPMDPTQVVAFAEMLMDLLELKRGEDFQLGQTRLFLACHQAHVLSQLSEPIASGLLSKSESHLSTVSNSTLAHHDDITDDIQIENAVNSSHRPPLPAKRQSSLTLSMPAPASVTASTAPRLTHSPVPLSKPRYTFYRVALVIVAANRFLSSMDQFEPSFSFAKVASLVVFMKRNGRRWLARARRNKPQRRGPARLQATIAAFEKRLSGSSDSEISKAAPTSVDRRHGEAESAAQLIKVFEEKSKQQELEALTLSALKHHSSDSVRLRSNSNDSHPQRLDEAEPSSFKPSDIAPPPQFQTSTAESDSSLSRTAPSSAPTLPTYEQVEQSRRVTSGALPTDPRAASHGADGLSSPEVITTVLSTPGSPTITSVHIRPRSAITKTAVVGEGESTATVTPAPTVELSLGDRVSASGVASPSLSASSLPAMDPAVVHQKDFEIIRLQQQLEFERRAREAQEKRVSELEMLLINERASVLALQKSQKKMAKKAKDAPPATRGNMVDRSVFEESEQARSEAETQRDIAVAQRDEFRNRIQTMQAEMIDLKERNQALSDLIADLRTTQVAPKSSKLSLFSGSKTKSLTKLLCPTCAAARVPILEAAARVHDKCLQAILSHPDTITIDACDSDGSALHRLARSGSVQATLMVLQAKISLDLVDSNGRTAVHTAALAGHLHVLRAMLDFKPNLELRDINGATPIDLAAGAKHPTCFAVLAKAGANSRGGGVVLPPLHRAAETGCISILGAVIEGGVAADETDSSGRTALHYAAASGHVDCVRYLVESCGADPNAESPVGPPLLVAAKQFRSAVMDELLKGGADPLYADAEGWSALHHVVHGGRDDCVQIIHDRNGNLAQLIPKSRQSAIHIAAAERRASTLELLIRLGLNPNAQDSSGNTALHVAALLGDEAIVRTLVANHASVTITNNKGDAPADIAWKSGNETIGSLLDIVEKNNNEPQDRVVGKNADKPVAKAPVSKTMSSGASQPNAREHIPLVRAKTNLHAFPAAPTKLGAKQLTQPLLVAREPAKGSSDTASPLSFTSQEGLRITSALGPSTSSGRRLSQDSQSGDDESRLRRKAPLHHYSRPLTTQSGDDATVGAVVGEKTKASKTLSSSSAKKGEASFTPPTVVEEPSAAATTKVAPSSPKKEKKDKKTAADFFEQLYAIAAADDGTGRHADPNYPADLTFSPATSEAASLPGTPEVKKKKKKKKEDLSSMETGADDGVAKRKKKKKRDLTGSSGSDATDEAVVKRRAKKKAAAAAAGTLSSSGPSTPATASLADIPDTPDTPGEEDSDDE